MENVIGMQPYLSAKKRFCAGEAKARIVESYEALCFCTELLFIGKGGRPWKQD